MYSAAKNFSKLFNYALVSKSAKSGRYTWVAKKNKTKHMLYFVCNTNT